MAEDELEKLARRAAEEAVAQTLTALGVDMSAPIEMQKDFAHLRSWRESTEHLKKQTLFAMIGVVVTGGLGLLVVAFRDVFHWPNVP